MCVLLGSCGAFCSMLRVAQVRFVWPGGDSWRAASVQLLALRFLVRAGVRVSRSFAVGCAAVMIGDAVYRW